METDADVPAGRATLSFRYEAPVGDVQEGAFRVTDGGAVLPLAWGPETLWDVVEER